MDFRAKLISGLEEKKLQDERDRDSGVKPVKPKNTQNQSTTATTSTSSSFDNSQTSESNESNNKENNAQNNNGNQNNNNKNTVNNNANKNKNNANKNNGRTVSTSLIMELMQEDQVQAQAAQDKARQMTTDAKNQRDAEADERKKTKALQREALERERESKTQILRKRIPGQVEQARPMYTLPPPDTPEQIKAKAKELKEMKARELEDLRILNEAKAKKAEEKKERKAQKKLNKDQNKGKPQQQKKEEEKVVVKEEPKVVVRQPQPPKPKTPEDLAAEKRAKILEEQAEAHRLKKQQVQLTKLAHLEAKKVAQAEELANKPKQKKEAPVVAKGNKNKALTVAHQEQQSNTTLIIVGSIALFAVLAYFLLVGQ